MNQSGTGSYNELSADFVWRIPERSGLHEAAHGVHCCNNDRPDGLYFWVLPRLIYIDRPQKVWPAGIKRLNCTLNPRPRKGFAVSCNDLDIDERWVAYPVDFANWKLTDERTSGIFLPSL